MEKPKQLKINNLVLKNVGQLSTSEKNNLSNEIVEAIDDVILFNTTICEILKSKQLDLYTQEVALSFINSTKSNNFRLAIYDENNKFVGLIEAIINDYNQNAIIGYWISQHQRRKGYITLALKRMVQSCFEDLNLHKLEVGAYSFNEGSNKVIQNAGFIKVGTKKESVYRKGKFHDLNMYEMMKCEYHKLDY